MRCPAEIVRHTGAKILETVELPARPEQLLPVPAPYAGGRTGRWLEAMTGRGGLLWRHQARALEAVAAGQHLVVATATASGKSLIFMTPIMHELIHGTGKALILYPQKALGADQLDRILKGLDAAGLPRDLVGEINGDVPMNEREAIINSCRLILATPDVIHCWLMRQVSAPNLQRFLANLRFLVIDEAHVLEGVFGSHCAYLFRRLRCARDLAMTGAGIPRSPLQIIAATATIRDPAGHMEVLTGCAFVAISDDANGAPRHRVTLFHVDGPASGAAGEKTLAELCGKVGDVIAPNALIAFADSRQGVERLTRALDRDDILPYRGGYEARDRRQIELRLRANELKGVVATSSLELGIDFPQITIGFNLGVPQTRKALRQRIGRVGRSLPGAFAVIAPASTFTQLGGSFGEYIHGCVEPSRLYLDNRFIQFQAARCLIEECGESERASLPTNVEWPPAFGEMFAAAQPGALRDRDLDQVAVAAGDSPHIAYPLRAIFESNFALRDIRNPQDVIGTIELEKALREAPPGATYHHLRKAYRVVEWRTNSYERSILLQPVKDAAQTQALLRTQVSVSTAAAELLDGHLREGDRGFMAEGVLKVSDSVEGYRIGSAIFAYRDLSKTNRRFSRKHREFSTTGVVLRIGELWFCGDAELPSRQRQSVAKAMAAVLASEHNIAPSDVRIAHQRIAICSLGGARKVEDAIVIFDNVVGGLRLTEPLFTEFPAMLDRLERAADVAKDRALLGLETIKRLRDWYHSLSPSLGGSMPPQVSDADGIIIFAPESEVAVRVRGTLVERKLIEPQLVTLGDADVLMYRYETAPGAFAWVAHEQVQPIGHNWQRAIWDPVSNEIRELVA